MCGSLKEDSIPRLKSDLLNSYLEYHISTAEFWIISIFESFAAALRSLSIARHFTPWLPSEREWGSD